MKELNFKLPLPPSKNERQTRTKSGHTVVTRAVRSYRDEVWIRLMKFKGLLPAKIKIVVECVWHKKNTLQDVSNFHDELCDAIFPALALNDRFALVRDMDFVVDPKNPHVEVRMWAIEAVL